MTLGKVIVEEDQQGKERAEYGKSLIKELSFRLTAEYGKGFDESNLKNIRQFYIMFPNCDALRHELTWTHYRLLLRIENEEARNFYTLETCGFRGEKQQITAEEHRYFPVSDFSKKTHRKGRKEHKAAQHEPLCPLCSPWLNTFSAPAHVRAPPALYSWRSSRAGG